MAEKSPHQNDSLRTLEEAIASLKNTMRSDKTKEFFTEARYQPYQYVSYKELLTIFGKEVNYDHVPSANRRLIKTHFLAYNQAFDNLWKYKYPILLSRLAYLACKSDFKQIEEERPQSSSTSCGSRQCPLSSLLHRNTT